MSWAFYIVAMFIGLSCITMLFFMPETKYMGSRSPNVPGQSDIGARDTEKARSQTEEDIHSDHVERPAALQKESYLRGLASFGRADPNVSFVKVLLRPFVLVGYPTVLWASLVYGVSLGWNVIIGASVAQLFGFAYEFDSQAQGLVFLSPFVGSIVGAWLCGSVSDSAANYLTRKNNGIREPEMRLPTICMGTVLLFAGALIASLTYHYHTHWAGPVIGLGVLTAGSQIGVSLSMSYALDCHKEVSIPLPVEHLEDSMLTSSSSCQ